MAVDIRLNQMIDALDGRLKAIPLEDVELSVRTLKALKDCGASTLHDAQMALINRTLRKQHGIGPRAVKEVEEVIASVCAVLPIPVPVPESKREKQLEQVLELFLSWTGALAISGDITRDAWCELVDMRAEAERVLGDD
jgi:hypothetical protein